MYFIRKRFYPKLFCLLFKSHTLQISYMNSKDEIEDRCYIEHLLMQISFYIPIFPLKYY